MLAKGRLLGLQFDVLLSNGLYMRLASHANEMAQKIAEAMKACGIRMLIESETNQIFPILENEALEKLREQFELGDWQKMEDDHTAIRIVTSWDTSTEAVDLFCAKLSELYK